MSAKMVFPYDKRVFFDTNIIIYLFDDVKIEKSTIVHELFERALVSGNGCISSQVVQEFLNLATRKFASRIRADQAREFLHEYLAPICKVYPSVALFEHALHIHERYKYSFYDSLIIAAAISAECKILYSEDMQHNQEIENLRIINPFAEG